MKKNKYVLLSVAVISCLMSFISSCKEEEPVNMAPVLDVYGTSEVMRQSVVMNGHISGNMAQVKSFGFQYSISDKFPSDQIGLAPVPEGTGAGEFHVHALGLKANTTYYYRAYATTGAIEVYSPIDQFTTLASSAPRLTHIATGEPGEDYVSLSCRIDEVGDEYLYEYGIQYRKANTTDPYISIKAEGIDEGYHFEVTVTGLESGKEYQFRPYAQNSDTPDGENGFRVGYGDEFTIKTARQQSAIVDMESIEQQNIGMTSITVSATAKLPEDVDGTVEECGFCYSSTTPVPNLADKTIKVEFPGLGETYRATLNNLSCNQKYYVRAYAKNKVNGELRIGYSEVMEVSTKPLNPPSISWVNGLNDGNSHYEVTPNSIRVTAQIDNFEENLLKEKGLIWSSTDNYNIDLEKAKESGNALILDTKGGGIDGTITNLEPNTSYYVIAYAIYELDGDVKEGFCYNYYKISTSGLELPTLSYPNYTDVTYQSANLSCEIESQGNGTIKERGFLISKYNDVSNPRLDTRNTTQYVVDGVEFSAKAEGLKYSTYYALRAYAISELGNQTDTIYSSTRTFDTEPIQDATFYDTVIKEDSTTYHSLYVTGGVNVSGDGEVIERGFCWFDYYNSSFEARDSIAVTSGTNEEFSSVINGLKPNTAYYVYTYAKKRLGDYENVSYSSYAWAYTHSVDLVTLSNLSVVAASYSSLTMSSDIAVKDGGELVEKGFCWKLKNIPTLEDCDGSIKVEGDSLTGTAEGLLPGNNHYYYVRAYAKVKVGNNVYVSYGSGNSYRTNLLKYSDSRTPYDTTCDVEISFEDDKAPISAVYVYVTTDSYNSHYYNSNPDLSKSTKFTLTKDEQLNKFTGVLDQLTEATTYYYDIYYQFNGQEVYLKYGTFATGRVPGIDDAVSPDKKE